MALCISLSLLPTHFAAADTANRLLITSETEPANQITTGTTFTATVKAYIDAASSPQSTQGTVSYPADKLDVVSKNTSLTGTNKFDLPTLTQGNGTIGFNASRNSSQTGVALLFTVTFKAKSSGTAVVGFSGDNKINNAIVTYKSVVISITSPTPIVSTAPSTPKPTTVVPSATPSVTPSTEPTAAPDDSTSIVATPDPTGVVTDVSIVSTYTNSTITWKVNAGHSKSSFVYGAKSSALNKQSSPTSDADGTFKTTISDLLPGTRYYFMITGTGDGNSNGTYSSAVITNGYPVTITVTENNIAAKNAQIQLGNLTKSTSENGKATLGLAEGTFTGKITTETASQTITVTVAKKTIPGDGSSPETQTFSYNLTSSPLQQGPGSSTAILTFVGILVGGSVLIGGGFVGFMTYRRRKLESAFDSGGSSTTVVIDDGYDWRQQANEPTPMAPSDDTPHGSSVHIDDEEPVDIFDKPQPPNNT